MARHLGRRILPGARTWDRHQAVDALVAGVVGVAAEIEAMVEAHGQPGLMAQAAPAGFVLGGLLLFRRKRPLLAMTLFTAVAILSTTVQTLVLPARERSPNQVVPIFAILVLSYSLGVFGSRRDLLLGLPQPLVVVVVNDLLQPSGNPIPGALAFVAVFIVGAPALGGRLIRGRQRLLEALAEQRRQLDIQRALQTRTALATERLQVAERLHEDLVNGLDSLLTDIDIAERAGEDLQTGSVAAIETRARTLLAQTRHVVVSLAAAPGGSAPGGSAPGGSAPGGSAPAGSAADASGLDPNPLAPGAAGTEADQAGVSPSVPTRPRTIGSTAVTWTALAAAAVGILSARSGMVEELRSNNELLAGQREARLRQAVAEERTRIARDLHDSIGHHLTIIALQAGAARRMWTSDPPKAKSALATVARVAAQGAAELRMGFDSGLVPAGAAASRTDIAALLDNARAAGLPVSVEGNKPDLPDDIELALFRVLQEALTNVLRHAPGAAADVTFRTDGSHVELVVTNSASDQPSTWVGGSSRGQRGTRQRAEEHGGRLDYGRRPDGGFEVRAWFPRGENT